MKKGVVANNKGILTNKGYKDIMEGITFVLWVVAIIGMLCVMYEVNELKELTKDASNFRSITYRKQYECKYKRY